jgi:hypothetical protein
MTRTKRSAIALTAVAAAISAAYAQEAPTVTGSVSLGGIHTDLKSDNAFRFDEYRDLSSGATGGMDLRGANGPWWYSLFGENLGRDDQYVQLKGGRQGIFKFAVYGDDIIHNTTHGALTPYSGVGTNNLTFSGATASTNVSTWNRFDYSVQHKNVGGFAEGQPTEDSPFYLRIQTNRKKSEGIRPLGAAQTSPGGPSVELPVPIDWTTTDVSGEAGYSSRKMHFAVSYLYSKFENDKEFLTWRNPFVTTGPSTEMSTIAADNKLERLAVNGILRGLWLDSTLAIRGVHTKTTSDFPIAPTFLSISGTTGNNRLSNASRSNFEGEVVNESVSAAFNSHIAKGWTRRCITTGTSARTSPTTSCSRRAARAPAATATCRPRVRRSPRARRNSCTSREERRRRGVPPPDAANRLAIGYDYLDIERERVDFSQSKEHEAWLELKSRSLEFADLAVKYPSHEPHVHVPPREPHAGRSTASSIASTRAPVDRDTLKITLDANPAPLFDIGGEVIYKVNRYGDTSSAGRRTSARSSTCRPPTAT